MDFIDKKDVSLLEVGEKRREIARLRDHRPRRHLEIHAKLAGNDLCERRFPQTGRTREKNMIELVAPSPCRVDENLEICARLGLPDELGEALRAQRKLACVLVLLFAIHETSGHALTLSRFAQACNICGSGVGVDLDQIAPLLLFWR